MIVYFHFPPYSFVARNGQNTEVKKEFVLKKEMKYGMLSMLQIGMQLHSIELFNEDKASFLIENPNKVNWSRYRIKDKVFILDNGDTHIYLEYIFSQVN